MIDEFVHHGAEISLLRDLWRWQHPLSDDPLVDRAMRGDLALVESLGDVSGERASALAAAYGRWELVRRSLAAGVAVPTSGTTPLHHAAIAGELEVVQLLVAHGADESARDPRFGAPPVEWARFMGQDHVVDWLSTPRPT